MFRRGPVPRMAHLWRGGCTTCAPSRPFARHCLGTLYNGAPEWVRRVPACRPAGRHAQRMQISTAVPPSKLSKRRQAAHETGGVMHTRPSARERKKKWRREKRVPRLQQTDPANVDGWTSRDSCAAYCVTAKWDTSKIYTKLRSLGMMVAVCDDHVVHGSQRVNYHQHPQICTAHVFFFPSGATVFWGFSMQDRVKLLRQCGV